MAGWGPNAGTPNVMEDYKLAMELSGKPRDVAGPVDDGTDRVDSGANAGS